MQIAQGGATHGTTVMWFMPLVAVAFGDVVHPFHRFVADGSEKMILSATEYCVQNSRYRIWYDALMNRSAAREIPSCYTEVHHIRPRSLGGSDASENLVRLTYREHFIAHWLLTKFTTGADLRKMQRALLAMTLPSKGDRIIAGWQFEAAKRAVRDLELDPVAEEAWRARFRQAQQAKIELRKARGLPVNEQQARHFQRKRERSR